MKKIKIAFYGNNLNQGYFFVRNLNRFGLQAKLFCIEYSYPQEYHNWWTDQKLDPDLKRTFKTNGMNLGARRNLRSILEIQKVYDEVKNYDIIVMMEDGPALFSELQGVKKVFLSQGADLQIMPFLLSIYYQPANLIKKLLADLRKVLLGNIKAALNSRDYITEMLRSARFQARQRKGLQQCSALICSPHQKSLIDSLHLDHNKVHYLSFPMDKSVLAEVDRNEVSRLRRRYADVDILFFHPTRQFYIRENNDRFLKDNDKLLYAYALFVSKTTKKVKLLLVLKGRDRDIAHSQRSIKEMNLEDLVEWLPEMPNKQLRAYYNLNQVVVCDQFSPHLAILGNIGREATFYGRLIITAFSERNHAYYGHDMPLHVFAAQTVDEIVSAMGKVISLSSAEKKKLSNAAIQWFHRNLDCQSLMPKYIDLFSKTLKSFP